MATPEQTEVTAPERPDFRCWDGVSASSLTSALSPPVTECVEIDLLDQYNRSVHGQHILGHLSLMVTTKSAYRQPVGKAFVAAMANRTPLPEDLRERIYTAIQEAMMNAVLHGNLRIGSGSRDSLEGLTQTHELIERMLATPDGARSAIRVDAIWNSKVLHVLIRDSGEGFDKAGVPSPEALAEAGQNASGRGLSILEAICDRVMLLHGGRTIKLGFNL
jgi:anti-sigma regulatory factor (Ser/Thr protein kinase)